MEIIIPPGIDILHMENKVRFRGPQEVIDKFATEFHRFMDLKEGDLCKLDRYILKVSDYMTEDRFKENWIELPKRAWLIMGSKFREVAHEYEENPFDFNDCGYTDRLLFDIGVEVTDLPQG